jgi:putative endonuclease
MSANPDSETLRSSTSRATAISARTGRISPVTATPLPGILACVPADSRLQRGAASEQLAAEYLRDHGLVILARNVRCRAGEIDLVCLDHGDVLAIIEVRQRGSGEFGGALGSVTWRKQRKIIRATQFLLQRQPRWRAYLMRFDVVALEGLPAGTHHIVWIKDAFRAA